RISRCSADVKTEARKNRFASSAHGEALNRAEVRRRNADQRCKMARQRIAMILNIEFKPLRRKDHCATSRPALGPRKAKRRILQHKEPPDAAVRFARDPKASAVAANEK